MSLARPYVTAKMRISGFLRGAMATLLSCPVRCCSILTGMKIHSALLDRSSAQPGSQPVRHPLPMFDWLSPLIIT